MILCASNRRCGKSLPRSPIWIGPVADHGAIAILFIIVIALSGLGLAVVNASREGVGTFTIAFHSIALYGPVQYRIRPDG